MAKEKLTPLQDVRTRLGFSLRGVSRAAKVDVSALQRVERGETLPTRATAEKIYKFYMGVVPIGVIYDTCHKSSVEWSWEKDLVLELANLAGRIRRKHKELAA